MVFANLNFIKMKSLGLFYGGQKCKKEVKKEVQKEVKKEVQKEVKKEVK